MTYPDEPAKTAGPNRDGSFSLAKESKAGIAVAFVLTALGNAGLEYLGALDTSGWTGWWATIAVAGVATGTALITSYLKKNR